MKKLLVRGKKGFTLIELLIVIAIIAILATIIILNVINARAKAARAKVGADMNVAAKTAAACVSLGGLLRDRTASLVYDATNLHLTKPICNVTNIATDEQAMATGNWPDVTASNGFSYSSVAIDPLSAPPTLTVAVIQGTATSPPTFTCTLTGCSGTNGW